MWASWLQWMRKQCQQVTAKTHKPYSTPRRALKMGHKIQVTTRLIEGEHNRIPRNFDMTSIVRSVYHLSTRLRVFLKFVAHHLSAFQVIKNLSSRFNRRFRPGFCYAMKDDRDHSKRDFSISKPNKIL